MIHPGNEWLRVWHLCSGSFPKKEEILREVTVKLKSLYFVLSKKKIFTPSRIEEGKLFRACICADSFLWLYNISLYIFTHFVYPFIHWWTFQLFPLFDYGKYCCHEHVCTCIWVLVFNSLGYIPMSGIARSYGDSMFNCLRNYQTIFHSSCIILHSH